MKHTDRKALFNSIAEKYDLLNNLMSLGRHKLIKRNFIKKLPLKDGAKVLDLCAGTGDISLLISNEHNKKVEITAVDFSENMLEIARQKAKEHENITFLQADVLDLPFEDNSFDAIFISFGLRNLKDRTKGFMEMQRVVKNGGYVANIDTGKPIGLFSFIFKLYFSYIVPLIGRVVAQNYAAYKYLPDSTINFPSQKELAEELSKLGFKEVSTYNYLFGTIAGQIAKK